MAGGLLPHLGQACRDARLAHGVRQIDIATIAGTDQATISRFERGLHWSLDPDAIVAAYALELELEAKHLWTDALNRWTTP